MFLRVNIGQVLVGFGFCLLRYYVIYQIVSQPGRRRLIIFLAMQGYGGEYVLCCSVKNE